MKDNGLYKVLRWTLIGQKYAIVRAVLLMAGAFFFCTLVSMGSAWLNGFQQTFSVRGAASMCFGAAIIYLLLGASQVLYNMKTKSAFVSYAMLPATKGQKFLANIIYQTLVRLAIIIVALLMADALQIIVSLVRLGNFGSLCAETCRILFGNGYELLLSVLIMLLLHSTFTFGGCFFRKHPLLLTMLAWIIAPMALGLICGLLVNLANYIAETAGYTVTLEWTPGKVASGWIVSAIVVAISAAFYWMAYRSFCRLQVINNRFRN